MLKHFSEQFPNAGFRYAQSAASGGRRRVEPANGAAVPIGARTKQPFPFHSVQQRIECSGAQTVTMAAKFFDHGQPEEFLLAGVMKDVQADEPRIKVLVVGTAAGRHQNRSTISKPELRVKSTFGLHSLVRRVTPLDWVRSISAQCRSETAVPLSSKSTLMSARLRPMLLIGRQIHATADASARH
jgi:hypothetical protein